MCENKKGWFEFLCMQDFHKVKCLHLDTCNEHMHAHMSKYAMFKCHVFNALNFTEENMIQYYYTFKIVLGEVLIGKIKSWILKLKSFEATVYF